MRMRLLLIWLLFVPVMTVFLIMFMGNIFGIGMVGSAAKMDTSLLQQKWDSKVILERIYLDGEISEEVVYESNQSVKDLCGKYAQWQLVEMNKDNVIFRKHVYDISPLMKANGFFGVSTEGVLSIYNGKPGQSNMIQSFYQIDIKKLESKKQEELFQGIPVRTKYRYVEVLETFNSYSTDKKQRN
jgi:forespore regulator of the sigma-K checkpoint